MIDLAALKRIVSAAALAGLVAGLLLTAVQHIQVIPLILQAEVYEQAAEAKSHSHAEATAATHHDEEGWTPADGWERTFFTALSNVAVALGFALLLGAVMSLRHGAEGWRAGLQWGAAAYAVFFVAPSLGLPPEVPGTQAAELSHRQLWWVLTAVSTAAGLGLIAFARHGAIKLVGAVLLALPHIIGAPQPQTHASTAPVELATAFIVATAIANAVFWLSLGTLVGFFYKKTA